MKKISLMLMILALGLVVFSPKAQATTVTATTDLYDLLTGTTKIATVAATATDDSETHWEYAYQVTNVGYSGAGEVKKLRVYNVHGYPITSILKPSGWGFGDFTSTLGYFEWATLGTGIAYTFSDTFKMTTSLNSVPGLQRADVWDSPDQGTGKTLSPVPEPMSLLLLGTGLLGLAALGRKKKRS